MNTTTAPRHTMKAHRFIGRCRTCKTVNVRTDILGWTLNTSCDSCKSRMTVKRIDGKVSATKCGPKCTGAIGPACDCECGGENHGGGHAL